MTKSTSAKHVPGPWRRNEYAPGKFGTIIVPANGDRSRYIAGVNYAGSIEATEATANLIAAAPELLAALRECVAVLEKPGDWGGANLAETNGGRLALKHARAALARVEGIAQ